MTWEQFKLLTLEERGRLIEQARKETEEME